MTQFNESQYDPGQVKLMEELLLKLDNDDNVIGTGTKKECHLRPADRTEKTILHRAFSVFLFHPTTGKLLIQERAASKITFPSLWTNTCCSHPLAFEDERVEKDNEGVRRAARRKLEHELGIPQDYSIDDFVFLTKLHYYADSNDLWAEHEIDYILFLTLDAKLDPSPDEVSGTKWLSQDELRAFFEDPASKFTPWFKLICNSYLYTWWDQLLAHKDPQGNYNAKALENTAATEHRAEILRM